MKISILCISIGATTSIFSNPLAVLVKIMSSFGFLTRGLYHLHSDGISKPRDAPTFMACTVSLNDNWLGAKSEVS